MTDRGKRHGAQVAALVLAAALMSGGKAAADFVINDDLIVIGSACVGLDCVDGEVFSFDTIILKENNLRIFFNDTSTSPGFPANDWRLIANDLTSGGSSFFAIEDATAARQVFKVEAGAAANSLFVDSTSRVGLRTSTPVLDLHINTSNTPGIRLEQNNSGGFTAQTWDIAGNEANFFVRDVTGGSRLPLRIRPGAPTSSIDIANDGDVGIGTGSPQARLHIFTTAATDIFTTLGVSSSGANDGLNVGYGGASFGAGSGFLNARSAAGNAGKLLFLTDGGTRMVVLANGNVGIGTAAPTQLLDVNGAIRAGTLLANPAGNTMCHSAANVLGNCTSDGRLKRDVEYLAGNAGLGAVMALKPAAFRWHDGDDRVMAGFVAQDTRAAIPAAVHQPAGTEFLALDTGAVLAYTVKALQELKADNDNLRGEIERLKAAR